MLLLCANGDGAPPSQDALDETYTFEEYAKDFDKSYTPEERARRQGIFENNLRVVLEHNRRSNGGHVLGVNHLMDLETHELPRGYDKSFHEAWGSGTSTSDLFLKDHQVSPPNSSAVR